MSMSENKDTTSRLGVAAVNHLFEQLGWAFREQPTSDFGIDAQAEKRGDDGLGTGKLIALQIKSGASWFRKRGADFVFYGEARHLEYWTSHSLPVFIVLHDPDTGLSLFQRVERHLVKEHDGGRWSITIPRTNVLDAAHERYLAAGIAPDEESLRRYRLALDLGLMRLFEAEQHAWLRLEEWHNKTLNFRGTEIIFDEDPDADADMDLEWVAAVSGVPRFMALHFPWLDYDVHEVDDERGAGEITMHTLEVRLSELGRAFVLLDDYYREGAPERVDADAELFADAEYEDYLSSLESPEPGASASGNGAPF
jgi:hypothetical protein